MIGSIIGVLRMKRWAGLLAMTVGFFAAFWLSFHSATEVLAYNNEGYLPCVWDYQSGGSNTLQIPWRNDPDYPPVGAYVTAWENARSDWYLTATPVVFVFNSSANHYLGQKNMGVDGNSGETAWGCWAPGFKRSWTASHFNPQQLDGLSDTTKRSTGNHELGHYVGIRHSTVTAAVMRTNRDREIYWDVYEDDECGVNSRYYSTQWPVTCSY